MVFDTLNSFPTVPCTYHYRFCVVKGGGGGNESIPRMTKFQYFCGSSSTHFDLIGRLLIHECHVGFEETHRTHSNTGTINNVSYNSSHVVTTSRIYDTSSTIPGSRFSHLWCSGDVSMTMNFSNDGIIYRHRKKSKKGEKLVSSSHNLHKLKKY